DNQLPGLGAELRVIPEKPQHRMRVEEQVHSMYSRKSSSGALKSGAIQCGMSLALPGWHGHVFVSTLVVSEARIGTSTSRTRIVWFSSRTTSRYSRIASVIFSNASRSVIPCEWQPGRLGTEAAKPSSDSSRMTW